MRWEIGFGVWWGMRHAARFGSGRDVLRETFLLCRSSVCVYRAKALLRAGSGGILVVEWQKLERRTNIIGLCGIS